MGGITGVACAGVAYHRNSKMKGVHSDLRALQCSDCDDRQAKGPRRRDHAWSAEASETDSLTSAYRNEYNFTRAESSNEAAVR
jgi:hypothetical protein